MEEKLERVMAKRVNVYMAPTDRLTNVALSGEAQENSLTAPFHKYITGNESKEITYAVMDVWDADANPDYNPASEVSTSLHFRGQVLDRFDKSVYNAILTLVTLYGIKYFSTRQVMNVMNGITNLHVGKKYSDEEAAEVEQSIRRLSNTKAVISCKNDLSDVKKLRVLEGNILNLEIATFIMNGKRTVGYKYVGNLEDINDMPIIYRYAKAKHQIQTMPVAMLNTPINKNRKSIILQEYLRERIAMISSEKSKVSNKILLESIIKGIGLDEKDPKFRNNKRRLLEQIDSILQYWQENKMFQSYEWEYSPERKNLKRAIVIHV